MNPEKGFNYRALFDLTGRLALVVGGGSGIGQASAEAMAAFGAHVVCADVNATDAAGVAQRICSAGGKATHATGDACNTDSVGTLIRGGERDFGALDVGLATPAGK